MTDLTLDVANGKLNIRVAAWIEREDHILVSTFPDGSMSLPGGRLQFSETTLAGIQREILEETGFILKATKLFAVIENFFFDAQYQKHFHEFLYVYTGHIDVDIPHLFSASHQEKISWMLKSSIKDLKPDVLQSLALIQSLEGVQHLVNCDD